MKEPSLQSSSCELNGRVDAIILNFIKQPNGPDPRENNRNHAIGKYVNTNIKSKKSERPLCIPCCCFFFVLIWVLDDESRVYVCNTSALVASNHHQDAQQLNAFSLAKKALASQCRACVCNQHVTDDDEKKKFFIKTRSILARTFDG